MKKRNSIFFLLITVVMLHINCRKEAPGNDLASIFTIPTGVGASSIVTYYSLDNSGNYLFIFLRDVDYSHSKILKVNTSTLKVEKQITFDGTTNTTVPIMVDNIVVTDKNELIGGFYNFYSTKQILIKFDADLNILIADTVANGKGGDNGRTRMVKNGTGIITGVFLQKDSVSSRWFFRYQKMDENLNILNSVTDTSSFYGSGDLVTGNFIKTSDGGYLTDAYDYVNNNALIEKRDANFQLLWRTRIDGGANPSTLNELNGKYFAYCYGDSLFTLIYDLNGILLGKKTYSIDGAKLSIDYEPMRKTDNSEFLLLARVVYNNNRLAQTGVLISADAYANIITSQTFGSNNMLGACLIKMNSNKFLLFYLDNSFEPEGAGQPRFIIRYVDAKGNFLN